MNNNLEKITHQADVCIIGGGMSGMIAAISAARHGAKVVLMHDRPVLGGNASSEVRMWIRGAAGLENRETGILQEIEMENIYRNPTMHFSLWDSVLWQKLREEENVTPLMNCACMDCAMEEGCIQSVTGFQLTTYQFHEVKAGLFIDCSGDSILAPLTDAQYQVGREGKDEFDEYGAANVRDRKTMGNTCVIQARQTDHYCPFIPPPFAYRYDTDESMHHKEHDFIKTGVNFWWIELGGEQNTIRDAEQIRDELIKTAYGVWDHIKNCGDHGADNYELEWIGFLPGKRESRRYVGDVLLNQRDLEENTIFEDVVAYGGWTMDNHAPEGFRYPGYSSRHIKPHVPYHIPFRALYSKNIPNLLFAGRNISATHMAMSSTRVMATCSLMGQAAGTAAALCAKYRLQPRELYHSKIKELQNDLMEDLCYLPGLTRTCPLLMEKVNTNLSEQQIEILQNGWERPSGEKENALYFASDDSIDFYASEPLPKACLRLVLDPDFSRESITANKRSQLFAMRSHIFMEEEPLKMPAALCKELVVVTTFADGTEKTINFHNNHKILLKIPVAEGAVQVKVIFRKPWQGERIGVFSCDIQEEG